MIKPDTSSCFYCWYLGFGAIVGLFAGISKPEHRNKAIPCSLKEEMVELNCFFNGISVGILMCICVWSVVC